MTGIRTTILCLAIVTLLLSPGFAAEPIVRPDRVPAFGRSVASTDDTTALVQNPANIAFLPGSELRWSASYVEDDARVPWQGHAFAFGLPLPFSLATGLRLDFLDPTTGLSDLERPNYTWLTWGLALRTSNTAALGMSYERSFSDGAFAGKLGTFSLALSTRPFHGLGISLVGRQLNAPQNDLGDKLGPSYTGALAIRPLGDRRLDLGLEATYLNSESIWVPRATLGVDTPVGRVLGDFSISDPGDEADRAWLASLGFAFYVNGMGGNTEFNAGAFTGNGLGKSGSYNLQTGVAFRSWREPVGITPGRRAIRIRIEDAPSVRGHVTLLRQLWSLADEPSIDAVVFQLKTSPANSLGHIQELRDAVFELRRRGKRTLCHLEDASGAALYFCAATNRIVMNPAGGLRFAGLRSEQLYFARLLDKLGIQADFIRIGAHKSAPEQFTRTEATDVARADKIDLIQQHERQFVEGVAVGRNLSFERVRKSIDEGPFVAKEAKQAGFIDDYAFDDEIEKQLNELVGRPTPLVLDQRRNTAAETFSQERVIALVYVNGDIVDGRSRTVPLLGMDVAGSYTISDLLKQLREDPRVGAIVVRVDSPGGSSMASDVMWREIKLSAKRKPVVVSMGSIAASGGYYLSASATRIFANPLTITGSIGIFYGKADVTGLLGKIGLDVEVLKTSEHADAESMFRPFTPEERRLLEAKVQQFYGVFLDRVAEGRNMSKEAVDKVAQGRVWTGEQAKQHGLVDELGGLRQALAYARKASGLPDSAPIVELPRIESSLIGRLLGIPGVDSSATSAPLPAAITHLARSLAPFVIHRADRPLARIELTPIEPW